MQSTLGQGRQAAGVGEERCLGFVNRRSCERPTRRLGALKKGAGVSQPVSAPLHVHLLLL